MIPAVKLEVVSAFRAAKEEARRPSVPATGGAARRAERQVLVAYEAERAKRSVRRWVLSTAKRLYQKGLTGLRKMCGCKRARDLEEEEEEGPAAKPLQPRPAPTAAGAEAIRQADREGLTLATGGTSSGYKGVCYNRRGRQHGYQATVWESGKLVNLGRFATPEEAALCFARREAGRDTSDLTVPPPPPPPPAPSSAAGAEAVRQAEREGLALVTSSRSSTSYKGVTFYPNQKGALKYKLSVKVGGNMVTLGRFATAEEAALFYARREAGRDMVAL